VTLTSEYIRHRVTEIRDENHSAALVHACSRYLRSWESVMSERAATADIAEAPVEETELADADLLVEEVSIDGMCGVY
jgi:mycofactocin precursor